MLFLPKPQEPETYSNAPTAVADEAGDIANLNDVAEADTIGSAAAEPTTSTTSVTSIITSIATLLGI